jgi:hypothetical protein
MLNSIVDSDANSWEFATVYTLAEIQGKSGPTTSAQTIKRRASPKFAE